MLIIGLTGGIGSGKTTVANLFGEKGVPIIDADIIAKDITQPGQMAFDAIVKHFGSVILLENGTLNRTVLRQRIFEHASDKAWLENLLHPIIEQQIREQIKQLSAPYCIVVIPLLFEVSPYDYLNRILVVDAPESLQIERVKKRDATKHTPVEDIMKTQVSREMRLAKADDIIINDGHLDYLTPQIEKLHKFYTKGV